MMDDTWTCHVCGRERPDEKISVQRNRYLLPGTQQEYRENVRYCNDNPQCAAGAITFKFFKEGVPL